MQYFVYNSWYVFRRLSYTSLLTVSLDLLDDGEDDEKVQLAVFSNHTKEVSDVHCSLFILIRANRFTRWHFLLPEIFLRVAPATRPPAFMIWKHVRFFVENAPSRFIQLRMIVTEMAKIADSKDHLKVWKILLAFLSSVFFIENSNNKIKKLFSPRRCI